MARLGEIKRNKRKVRRYFTQRADDSGRRKRTGAIYYEIHRDIDYYMAEVCLGARLMPNGHVLKRGAEKQSGRGQVIASHRRHRGGRCEITSGATPTQALKAALARLSQSLK